MNELYLIGRLGALHGLMTALIIVSATILIFAMIFFYVVVVDEGDYGRNKVIGKVAEDIKPPELKKLRRVQRTFVTTLIIGVIGLVLIPSERELYFIYGVGTAVDYVKSNETAKQLPDKAIQAIDKWLDEQNDK